jgi:beta-phosphoglucomutase
LTINFGVLWDMDGVLIDTGELHFQSWVETLNQYGFNCDREFFVETFGMNNTSIITRIFGHKPNEKLLAEIADKKEEFFRQAVRGHAQPMPGVIDWLDQLKKWGFRQAVASSAPITNVTTVIDELKLASYFDVMASGANMPGKPNPAIFLETAQKLKVEPVHCVVVEDAIAGVQAAKTAGMKCVAVLTTNPPSVLQDADVITERLDQLSVDVVRQLLNKPES